MPLPDGLFLCMGCGVTFLKAWTDEESRVEAKATFTMEELEQTALICDPCWRAMRALDPEFDQRYKEVPDATA